MHFGVAVTGVSGRVKLVTMQLSFTRVGVEAGCAQSYARGCVGLRSAPRTETRRLLAQATSRRHVEVCSPECVSVSPAPGNVQELESLERVRNRRVDDQSSVLHVQAE